MTVEFHCTNFGHISLVEPYPLPSTSFTMPSPRRSGGAPPSSFRVNFDPYRTEVPALNNSGNATSDPFSSTMHTGSYYNLTLWNQNREEDQRSFLFMRDGGEAPRFRRPKTIERSTGSYQKSKLSQCTSIDDTCSERGQCGGSRFSDSNEADGKHHLRCPEFSLTCTSESFMSLRTNHQFFTRSPSSFSCRSQKWAPRWLRKVFSRKRSPAHH
ncbi:hypothetical protein ARMGADRAFT_283997 [Armillaria gallica]|uniref:Uncharacterized protein n=1 Tax=Armillaria gallica TaxID=47427 RepID=A0A2H3D6U5_ARMGA|nr:hypothetical protein ARMGADRAFT_283997 [Armillaria gallica]